MLSLHTNEDSLSVRALASLAPEPSSVAEGRKFVRDTLRQWHLRAALIEEVELVASELITNAVLHAGSAPTVRMMLHGDHLRLEISDASTSVPQRRDYGLEAATGRGIMLVDSMATRWGAQLVEGGKVVWCEFTARPLPVDQS
jgi:anti-sigma regulatory factor (Ser/Thr protein kinase)